MTAEVTVAEAGRWLADWVWLAGFVDGEGNIGIYVENDRRKGPEYGHPRACLQVVNTHEASIANCLRIVGSGDTRQVSDGDANHKPQYRFVVRRLATLSSVLSRVLPYLVTKRRQAELCLEYVNSRQAARGMGRHAPFTDRELEIIRELRPLNRTGGIA